MLALATLTTRGRALGYCVVAALQDPRKDVLTLRAVQCREGWHLEDEPDLTRIPPPVTSSGG